MWWLLGPAVVFAITLVVSGFMFLRLLDLTSTDAVVPVDGATHSVAVESEDERMIWVDLDAATPDCEVRDATSGKEVELRRVTLKTVRDSETGDESGRWQFDPGGGDLEVSCTGGTVGDSATIGPAVSGKIMLTEFAPWLVLAMLLSAVWIGWLVVLVIKLVRKPVEPMPPPAGSPPS
jgi:hypothetical protein